MDEKRYNVFDTYKPSSYTKEIITSIKPAELNGISLLLRSWSTTTNETLLFYHLAPLLGKKFHHMKVCVVMRDGLF